METGKSEESAYNVSGLIATAKGLLERNFFRIYVCGEISGFKVYPSGHAYFTLKDENSQIAAVMFKSCLDRCKAKDRLKDGAKVCLYATVSIYPQRGTCQLNVLAAKLVGKGDLMQRYLELKERLSKEGLFDSARKRALPFMPRRIGLVTSPAGAVVHDMCRVLCRRFPGIGIRIFPANVQGEDAPQSLLQGIRYFNSGLRDFHADLLIIARGGGSFEDLFCFNDEHLVRAVASSAIPVISAVGHETDFTLCDFAADLRAGTPSMAAEIAVPERNAVVERLKSASSSILAHLRGMYELEAQKVDRLSDVLSNALSRRENVLRKNLDDLVSSIQVAAETMRSRGAIAAHTLNTFSDALESAAALLLERKSSRLNALESKLSVLSPYSVLDRGYSLTTDAQGNVIKSCGALAPGDVIVTRLADGGVRSAVLGEGGAVGKRKESHV